MASEELESEGRVGRSSREGRIGVEFGSSRVESFAGRTIRRLLSLRATVAGTYGSVLSRRRRLGDDCSVQIVERNVAARFGPN